MKETFQQQFWIPERGIIVTLPPHATQNLSTAQINNDPFSPTEGERLRIISKNGIMRKRFPTPDAGWRFMETVDYERCHQLLEIAYTLSDAIRNEWQVIQPQEPIAILLFGSAARGLTMGSNSPYVSNIDLEVLGNISAEAKEALLTAIQTHRKRCQQMIIESTDIELKTGKEGYPFVQVQDISKVKNGGYSEALELVGSCAFPLHDPENIWQPIEEEALQYSYSSNTKKRNSHRYKSLGIIYQKK